MLLHVWLAEGDRFGGKGGVDIVSTPNLTLRGGSVATPQARENGALMGRNQAGCRDMISQDLRRSFGQELGKGKPLGFSDIFTLTLLTLGRGSKVSFFNQWI